VIEELKNAVNPASIIDIKQNGDGKYYIPIEENTGDSKFNPNNAVELSE